MKRRLLLLSGTAATAMLVGGCASQQLDSYT
ncbi:MAG: hypothetical protein RL081_1393, partial [Pseudomonadota bacterium]